MVLIEGFCLSCANDVPITAERRCVADGSLCIPPSTACPHLLLIDGAWSACRCKPVAAGTWRSILSQQAKAIKKRDQDRAARQFMAAGPKPPKLTTARKPTKRRAEFRCPKCTSPGKRYGGRGLCATCYQLARKRAAGVRPWAEVKVNEIPCPVCQTPFKPRSFGPGRRKKTCSEVCGRTLSTQTQTERRREAVAS